MNFQAFLATLKADVFLAVLPIAGKLATNIAANPSALNATAQFSQLLVDVPAALISVEPQVLGALATAVNTEIQAAIAKAQADASAPAAVTQVKK